MGNLVEHEPGVGIDHVLVLDVAHMSRPVSTRFHFGCLTRPTRDIRTERSRASQRVVHDETALLSVVSRVLKTAIGHAVTS